MSGFVAVWNLDRLPVDREVVGRMRDTLSYRGVAGAGLRTLGESGEVALAFRAQTPLEPYTPEQQPLGNEEGMVWLVFDGRILNARELAARYGFRGGLADSASGAALLLHLYEVGGAECVRLLNGEFSFVLWDARARVFLGARDRLGFRPFHYHFDGRRLICASEAKAILADPSVRRAPCYEGVAGSLFAGAPLGDRTAFAGIRQLLPGQMIVAREGRVETCPYWDVEYRYAPARSDAEVVEELRVLLDDAVRIRRHDDAPIGCQLSGGLDSSVVTGLVAQQQHPVKVYSIRFAEGGKYDESRFARTVAAHVGADYHEHTPTAADLAVNTPALLWHHEMPPPTTGGFSYYAAAQLAAGHVPLLFAGHGGDELFGGYPRQFEVAFGSMAMFEPGQPSRTPEVPLLARARRALRRGGARRILARLLPRGPRAEDRTPESHWVRLHCNADLAANPLLGDRFIRALADYSPYDDYLAPFRTAPTDVLFDRCLYHDLRVYLPTLLHQVDRVSAAVGIEVEAPLLDHRIVELLATIPPEQKVRGLVPKYLLREAASPWLPEEIVSRRDKAGFPVPIPTWLSGPLRPWADRILLSPQCLDRGVFDPDELRRGGLGAHERMLVVNMELWFRIFIDQDPEWCEQTDRIAYAAARRGRAEGVVMAGG